MTAHTIEYTRYLIPEQLSAQFLAAYTRAAVQLAAAPQCVDYELARCEDDFEHFVLRVTWTSTEDHVEGFRESELSTDFAAEVGPFDRFVEETRHYTPTAVRGTGAAVPTLYALAGGAEAFARLTEVFHDKVLKDDVLAPVFEGLTAEDASRAARWLGEVFDGPPGHSDTPDGGHGHAAAVHLGREITERQRRRWVNLLQDAADEADLPTDPEFRSAFAAQAERQTRRTTGDDPLTPTPT
ncbi:antibiotic biosynthesis monooxygenase [Streptomyces sp. CWNU-52B]|uniref:globin domain-containing protein n=1 Tax=unclassified Streptomyces TaxID=2593676 RepID=UPI0039C02A24